MPVPLLVLVVTNSFTDKVILKLFQNFEFETKEKKRKEKKTEECAAMTSIAHIIISYKF